MPPPSGEVYVALAFRKMSLAVVSCSTYMASFFQVVGPFEAGGIGDHGFSRPRLGMFDFAVGASWSNPGNAGTIFDHSPDHDCDARTR